jgi:raffinose/stachyose/melibiose transport system permease protein
MTTLTATASVTSRSRSQARKRRRALAGTAVMLVIAIFWASPILILITTSLKTAADFATSGALSLPSSLSFGNFKSAWAVGQFGDAFRNSGLVTLVKVPVGILLASLLSYALAKLKIHFRSGLTFFMLLGLTVPIFIAAVPVFTLDLLPDRAAAFSSGPDHRGRPRRRGHLE